jgi:hypothetical protein
MTVNENSDAPGHLAIVPRLITAAEKLRANEDFFIASSVTLIFTGAAVLIMHTANYAANIHSPLAFGGALVDVLLPMAFAAALVWLWPLLAHSRWIILAVVAALVTLFLAGLAPVTAGNGWLSVLLFVLVTLVWQTAGTVWLIINRPWESLPKTAKPVRSNP